MAFGGSLPQINLGVQGVTQGAGKARLSDLALLTIKTEEHEKLHSSAAINVFAKEREREREREVLIKELG
ncbi:hypothetical protein TNCV_1675521 [Trichonephila clavipes]|nr:hypothetical protein TNCV_1675521 [Trichonephila clavipes]